LNFVNGASKNVNIYKITHQYHNSLHVHPPRTTLKQNVVVGVTEYSHQIVTCIKTTGSQINLAREEMGVDERKRKGTLQLQC